MLWLFSTEIFGLAVQHRNICHVFTREADVGKVLHCVWCDVKVYSRPSSERRSLTQWVTTVVPCSLMVLFVEALVEETRARTDVQWQMMGPLVG